MSLTGDTRGAFEQFQETVRRSPGFSQAHYSLGVLLAVSGRIPGGDRALLDRGADTSRTTSRRGFGWPSCCDRAGRPEAALTQYAQVIAIDPRAAEAQFGYAMALVQLKRYEEARRRLTEGASLYPERREFAEALARLRGIGRTRQ